MTPGPGRVHLWPPPVRTVCARTLKASGRRRLLEMKDGARPNLLRPRQRSGNGDGQIEGTTPARANNGRKGHVFADFILGRARLASLILARRPGKGRVADLCSAGPLFSGISPPSRTRGRLTGFRPASAGLKGARLAAADIGGRKGEAPGRGQAPSQ